MSMSMSISNIYLWSELSQSLYKCVSLLVSEEINTKPRNDRLRYQVSNSEDFVMALCII